MIMQQRVQTEGWAYLYSLIRTVRLFFYKTTFLIILDDGELTPYEFCDYFRSKMSTLTTEDFAKAKDDIAQFRQQGRTYFNMAYQQSCNEQDGDAFGKFEKCASAECTEEELKLKCATRKLKPAPVLQQTENKTIAFPEAPVATEAAAPTAPVEGSSSSSSNTTTSDVQPLDFGAIIKQQIRELQANLAIEIILFVGLLVLTVFSFMFLSWWYSMLAVITLLILMILVVVDSLRLALTRKAMSAFG
jgi:hypothetical protein